MSNFLTSNSGPLKGSIKDFTNFLVKKFRFSFNPTQGDYLSFYELIESYIFLRQVEHRLQMQSGTRTHSLPNNKKNGQIN
mgnify:CR=1 FL=1